MVSEKPQEILRGFYFASEHGQFGRLILQVGTAPPLRLGCVPASLRHELRRFHQLVLVDVAGTVAVGLSHPHAYDELGLMILGNNGSASSMDATP